MPGMAAEERPGAQEWVPPSPTIEKLRAAAQDCRGCELYRDATQAVMGRGASGARLVLLGEQPGDQEDQQGEPFVGPAGRVLDRALAQAGIDPSDTYTTNVVKHFRWRGTRGKQRIHQSPSQVHVAACGPWLVAEFSVLRPTGVVLLGGTAGKAVYGTSFRVGERAGTWWTGRSGSRSATRPSGCWPPRTRRRSCAPTTAMRRTTAWWPTSASRPRRWVPSR